MRSLWIMLMMIICVISLSKVILPIKKRLGFDPYYRLVDKETKGNYIIGHTCMESYPCMHYLFDSKLNKKEYISAVAVYALYVRNNLEPPEHFRYVEGWLKEQKNAETGDQVVLEPFEEEIEKASLTK